VLIFTQNRVLSSLICYDTKKLIDFLKKENIFLERCYKTFFRQTNNKLFYFFAKGLKSRFGQGRVESIETEIEINDIENYEIIDWPNYIQ
jgi:hypothetical protein